jgi:deoxycytidylate deaminase
MSAAAPTLLTVGKEQGVATTISERLSQELVIALVGPVASGVSTASKILSEALQNQYKYKVASPIKLSDFIRSELFRIGKTEPARKPLGEYIQFMQDAGNTLRARFGRNYLAEKAIEQIVLYRKSDGGYNENNVVLPGRRAYIIDSLKNADELNLLRQIYGDTLCVIGVFAPDKVRKERLKNDGTDDDDVKKILTRDDKEVMTFGQQTRDIFVQADFFICNDKKPDEMRLRIERYLEIIFDVSIHTPNVAEMAMYAADASASNSACMSRQVGAAIVSDKGELISVGRNDVPKFKGGLYTEDDQAVLKAEPGRAAAIEDQDFRCFKWGRKVCHNDEQRSSILDKIIIQLGQAGLLKAGIKTQIVKDALVGTGVDSLTEFSRSIHAEMEAILAVAREGRHSLVGATLYTTTYPCHNCARHIVAAGITNVVYIQPYKKSLAKELHSDTVTEDVSDSTRVVFRQYDGVAPRNYLRLFRPSSPRKKDGRVFRTPAAEAVPVFRVPLDGPVDYESQIIVELENKEQNL